jgi:tripartite-type tricarboxylate transporter receptor subunit TctC
MRYIIGAIAATFAALQITCHAADSAYPSRPIELVVPYPPGGAADLLARLLTARLDEHLGQPVVVVNRGGAGGNIAAQSVAAAAADGYTLLFGNVAVFSINPNLYRKIPFDPIKDFAPISLVAVVPQVLVVHPSVPVKSVAEFVEYAKARPGKLNYASGSYGSATQLSMELLKTRASIDLFHVPYKGSGPALAAISAGQVSAMIENVPTALPFVRDGRLRALAVTSAQRSSMAPDLPTLAESGFPGYEMLAWFGVQAPDGTPPDVVRKLNLAVTKTVRSAEIRERMASLGAEPTANTPQEFAEFIRSELRKWGDIVKRSGAVID